MVILECADGCNFGGFVVLEGMISVQLAVSGNGLGNAIFTQPNSKPGSRRSPIVPSSTGFAGFHDATVSQNSPAF
jgi:hypothetical protein